MSRKGLTVKHLPQAMAAGLLAGALVGLIDVLLLVVLGGNIDSAHGLPVTIDVIADETVTIDVNIDTGIR